MNSCAICSGTHFRKLHRQAFLLPGSDNLSHYDVVACENCGFLFADNIPAPLGQSDYYETSERHLHVANLPAGLAEAHRTFFDYILTTLPDLSKKAAILDIGSSIGHFLSRFQTAGFNNIQGLEPSISASILAKETYGISVTPTTLENFHSDSRFDLVTLCGVLEHLPDLRNTVEQISNLCADGGFLFIAVPDASTFGHLPLREPFLEFALEHINFFTPASLDNLLLPLGFNCVDKVSLWNGFYANNYLLALYQKHPVDTHKVHYDPTGIASLTSYIALSRAHLAKISSTIDAIRDSAEPIAVWGAGSLTSRLCATTSLPECNIVTFIDSNTQLHDLTLLGRTILTPDWLQGKRDLTVLVASYVYGDVIERTLTDSYAWRGRIIKLDAPQTFIPLLPDDEISN